MKRIVLLVFVLALPVWSSRLVAKVPRLDVDASSLPEHWYVRDARAFVKLGLTPQTLVYQPGKGETPRATVFLESRAVARRLPDDPDAWTKILIPTPPGPRWGMERPSLTYRAGLRIWRAELHSDTDANVQHWIMMQAIERDGAVLVMAFEQTRGSYQEGLPFVLDLFEHVRPTRGPN